MAFQSTPSAWRETMCNGYDIPMSYHFNPLPPHGGRPYLRYTSAGTPRFQSTPSAWRETDKKGGIRHNGDYFNPLPPHGGRLFIFVRSDVESVISIHSLRMEGDLLTALWRRAYFHFNPLPPHGGRQIALSHPELQQYFNPLPPHGGRHTPCQMFCDPCFISIHSLRMEGDSKTAQESVFHFAYPCTILQKRMQKTTFCTRKNGFFRKKGEKFGAKPSASFCAPMIRTDTFPLNFSHRISGSSMSMVSFAPICSTFD